MRFKPARKSQRIGALRLHADAQGLQPLDHDPGTERRQRHAGGSHNRAEHIDDQTRGSAKGAGHHTPLAIEILGARVDHQVSTHLDGALQRGGAKAVVNSQQRTRAMGQFGQRTNVADIRQRIGRRLGKKQFRGGPNRGLPLRQIGL